MPACLQGQGLAVNNNGRWKMRGKRKSKGKNTEECHSQSGRKDNKDKKKGKKEGGPDTSALKLWVAMSLALTVFLIGKALYQRMPVFLGDAEYKQAVLQEVSGEEGSYSGVYVYGDSQIQGAGTYASKEDVPEWVQAEVSRDGSMSMAPGYSQLLLIPVMWLLTLVTYFSCVEDRKKEEGKKEEKKKKQACSL